MVICEHPIFQSSNPIDVRTNLPYKPDYVGLNVVPLRRRSIENISMSLNSMIFSLLQSSVNFKCYW
jgi:hypothetical protein